MTEEAKPTRVEMSVDTAQALRDRGGALYVWVEGGGILRTRTTPPTRLIDFERFNGDRWVVRIERNLAPVTQPRDAGPRWVIKRKRFPWPRFAALYNPSASEWGGVSLGDIVFGIATEWP